MERNPSQKRAIAHREGPCMVLAGPGSGKTSVIVERTAGMITDGKIDPAHILVVTFSKAAAVGMRERFLRFMHLDSTPVTFGTFHGVFYGILKQTCSLGPGNILSEEEKTSYLRELLIRCGNEETCEVDEIAQIAKEISTVKGGRIPLEHFYSSCLPDEVFRKIYNGYRQKCRARRKLDFDDMLLDCYDLLKRDEAVLAQWRDRFRYILVDEFQDINQLQYDTIRLLAAPHNNLFIVGDDDQSIYHFRGARPQIMLNFPKDYPDAQIVQLEINYRCSPQILRTAVRVIECNHKRYPKKLSTPNPPVEPVACLEYASDTDQYADTADMIRKSMEAGAALKDTAILLRTNGEARGLLRALAQRQIPFLMKEVTGSIFEHWICRDLLAYLRFAAGERSRDHFVCIMNRPLRYFSREGLVDPRVTKEALLAFYDGKDWMRERVELLFEQLDFMASLPPYAAIRYLRQQVGYEGYLETYAVDHRLKPEELYAVLDELTESARGKRTLAEWETGMREYERMLKEAAGRTAETDAVTISTLHASKGLEYDRVFILNVNEGQMPYRKAVLPEHLEEERRLFYVGMTRARKQLILSYCRKSLEKERIMSRFLKEAGLSHE